MKESSLKNIASSFRIALVGNPNCGKTALFNGLTGSRQKVANYAGVTVDKKEGIVLSDSGNTLRVVDLPGTYSLRARSLDERITRDVVLGQKYEEEAPDAVICVADATNLHLGLRLVLELKKTGLPVVLALNMFDVASRRGYSIDQKLLSQELGCPVVPTVATRKKGLKALIKATEDVCTAREQIKANLWTEPTSQDVRLYHKEVERILSVARRLQGSVSTHTYAIDRLLLHPVFGVFFFILVLFFIFQSVFFVAKIPQEALQSMFDWLQNLVSNNLPNSMISSLLSDGIIAGIGSIVVFLPQILFLFLFILILEDSGYMARAAFLMDRIMSFVGLPGKGFISLLSSFACAIPGIMATRTIESRRDRIILILISPLMTCSARLPVYTLLIGSFIPHKTLWHFFNLPGLVMFLLYAAGLLSGLGISALVAFFMKKHKKEPLLMILPSYKMPDFKGVLIGVWFRAQVFLKKAGTTILFLMIVIWFLSNFPSPPLGHKNPAIDYSFAGMFGHWVEPFVAPLGFSWQIAVALIPGLAAREVAVAALGSVYAISGNEDAVRQGLSFAISHSWSLATALSLLAWYVFAPQCVSTLAVAKRETHSYFWPIFMFIYMMTLAYLASFLVYNIFS